MPVRSMTQDTGRASSAPRPTDRRNPSSTRMSVTSAVRPGGAAVLPHRSRVEPGGMRRACRTQWTIESPAKRRRMRRLLSEKPQAKTRAGSFTPGAAVLRRSRSAWPTRADETRHLQELVLPERAVGLTKGLDASQPAYGVQRVQVLGNVSGDLAEHGQITRDRWDSQRERLDQRQAVALHERGKQQRLGVT